MGAERSSGWRTCFLVGCIAALVLGTGAMALVAANWERVSGVYHRTTDTIADCWKVQSVLRKRYPSGKVSVTARKSSDVPGTALAVDFQNPRFLEGVGSDTPAAQALALEIATAARDALPAERSYDRYEIVFTRQVSLGLTVSRTQRFVFDESELPPAQAR
jgi:hypothetical protein